MPALSRADHAQNILLTPEERAWLLDHPVVQVAFDKNLAPVEYRDKKGHPQGLSADYLQRFGTRLGIRFEIPKFTNWTQAMTALKSGRVDMASAIQVTDERKKYLDFTSSYLSLPISVFTREQALYIAYLVQFEGAKVAVVDGYPIKEYLLRDYPLIELVTVKSIEKGLELLAEGRVDAYIGSQVATSYALTRGGFANIKIAGDTPYHYELSMAGRKDQPLLTSILQKALDKVSPEERSRMLQRWFAVNFEHHFDYALFYKIGIPLLLLLGLFIYWNRRLSREIGLRHSSERRFRSLIEGFSLDYMFFAYDLDGTLNYLSPSAEQFTHLKASDLIGKKWHSLPFADQVENQLKQIDKAVKRGETPPAVEIEFNARDGSWRCWRISVHPNFDENNQPIGVDGIVNEITEQKIAGLKLLQAKEAAESASRAKSRFLASMSHELRTPLTSILGYSYLLQKKTDLPDQVMRKIKTIHNSGQHLGKMINDVLEISRIEAGHHDLHIESFELRPFLVEIREMFQLQAQEQGLQLIFDLPENFPETISTDQGKLRQILINLLGNACKFTEEGKIQVKLDWHWLNESHIELQVTVEDTGPGISSAELLNLFQPFEQGRAGRKKGGTHLPVRIRPFVSKDGDPWFFPLLKQGLGSGLRGKGQMIAGAGTVKDMFFFLIGTGGLHLQPFQLVAGLFPLLPEHYHRLIHNQFTVILDPDLSFCSRGSQKNRGNLGLGQNCFDCIKIALPAFDDQAQLFGKQGGYRLGLTLKIQVEATVAGKGHLQHRGDQAAVTAVMAGQDKMLFNHFLDRCKGPADKIRIIHVRAVVAQPAKGLGQGGAAKSCLSRGKINQQQGRPRLLDVRGDDPGDITYGSVGRDDQLPGRFYGFIADHGGHGQGILTAVNSHAGGDHGLGHGPGRIV
ncbi:MAG: transporter substrate-binding domain-containing protein [Geopsychrobacter sp.]|nr:transporter substrate-binding domain-containing protein [Geopsychrobacter sp.]